jgi:hypothetical protein
MAMDSALRHLFDGPLFVGLARGGDEEQDRGYTRQPIDFSSPSGQDDGSHARESREVIFPAYVNDAASPIDSWFIVNSAGAVIADGQFESAREFKRRDRPVLDPGAIVVGLR